MEVKKWLKVLPGLLIFSSQLSVAAEDSPVYDKDSTVIYFKVGQSNIDMSFIDNAASLMSIQNKLQRLYHQDKLKDYRITVYAGASPEGTALLNNNLAMSRAKGVMDNIFAHTSLTRDDVTIKIRGVDWGSLTSLVETSYMPYKDEMLSILKYTPERTMGSSEVVYPRKEQMEKLHGGVPYKWMYDVLFKRIRYASVVIDNTPEVIRDTIEKVIYTPADTVRVLERVTTVQDFEDDSFWGNLKWAVKNNVVYDLMATPNIGGDIYLANNWSLTGNFMYSRWRNDDKHRYWCIHGGDLGARKWIGYQAQQEKLTGHHVGFFIQGLTYDVEFGGKGYRADHWNYGASFEYGFSLPVAKRLNLDFSVGLGYFGGEYSKYRPQMVNGEDKYVWQESRRLNWFGPTKVEASLVILLGKGNK